MNKNNIYKTILHGGKQQTNLAYLCEKCNSKNIRTYEIATRSADEPVTIFGTCLDCKHTFCDKG